MAFVDYVRAAVCEPLGISLDPQGHPGAGMHALASTIFSRSGANCSSRLSLQDETHDEMVAVQFPGLDGVLPDFGRFSPLDWGLGVELKGSKDGHWSGSLTSSATFGHFGGSGTFLWVDPRRELACVASDHATVRGVGEGRLAATVGRGDQGVRLLIQPRSVADPIITLDGVSKAFGTTQAVSNVSFQVMPGRCVGWLGPNGSGKTTLIRCMLGLARTTTGTITVRGHAIPGDVRQALTRVGAIVEEPRFYPYLSGKANLEVAAKFVGGDAATRIDWALERVDLVDRSGSKVKEYSLGMRQRLGVARSLLNDPELLILDEPSNGLDPAGIVEFRQMIRSFVEDDGRTVFISSHLLDEVQKMADDIAIVQSGKLVLHGSVDAARRRRAAVDASARGRSRTSGRDALPPRARHGRRAGRTRQSRAHRRANRRRQGDSDHAVSRRGRHRRDRDRA